MTDEQLMEEFKWEEREMRSWGRAPRDLSKLTPWQVAVRDRNEHLINWVLGNRPEPPPFEEWRNTLPPRTVYREDGK